MKRNQQNYINVKKKLRNFFKIGQRAETPTKLEWKLIITRKISIKITKLRENKSKP